MPVKILRMILSLPPTMPTHPRDHVFPAAQENRVLAGFPAVIDSATHTLILGSFPGEASLTAQQYYAFKHNQFWRLLSAIMNTDLRSLSYQEKLRYLLSNGIGLWDIFQSCQREGSLDSAIRAGQLNDFARLKKQYPALQRVCFNGKTAAKIQQYFLAQGYKILVLPSSSPANATQTFEQKLNIWRNICLDDTNIGEPQ